MYIANEEGLLSPSDLAKLFDEFLRTGTEGAVLPLSSKVRSVAVKYISGNSVEAIANEMNVTRERIRQIIAKAQRTVGFKPPPPTIEEEICAYSLDSVRSDLGQFLSQFKNSDLNETEKDNLFLNLAMKRFVEYLKDSEV